MSKKLLLYLFAFILTVNLASAQSKGNAKAAKYNDKIVKMQHVIYDDFVDLIQSFKETDAAKIDAKRKAIIADVDKALTKLKAMDGFDGDNKFKDGAVALFEFQKKTLEKEYAQMMELIKAGAKSSKDPKVKAVIDELIKAEEEEEKKFSEIQMEFAKKHGLQFKESSK